MATTTNFNWETPDDTDLVKDGAAAIRTALNGVDTSFVDLKGGTTGQVLSKASSSDMDFTWITNDIGDITGVTAGSGLSGGGTSGDVTVSLNLASANVFTQPQTATSFIVTGSTIPANGVYLPAANTLGLATNGTQVLQVNANGNFGIVGSTNAAITMRIGKNLTGGTSAYGIVNRGSIQSDVTNFGVSFWSNPDVAAASFTLGNIYHFGLTQGTIGVGATVTNQMGYYVDSSLTGATNNYGFYSNITSSTGRWNSYMNGTAANYFAGQTTVGSTSLTLGSGSVAQQFGVVSTAATSIVEVIRGAASQTANLTQWQNSAATTLTAVTAAGTINFASGNTSTTATAGAITAPAQVTGFITMQIAGTTVKVPYYSN